MTEDALSAEMTVFDKVERIESPVEPKGNDAQLEHVEDWVNLDVTVRQNTGRLQCLLKNNCCTSQ